MNNEAENPINNISEKNNKKGSWLDVNMGKFISRTLFVFIISTGLFWVDKIGEDNWTYIALLYIGTTKAKDFAILRWGK